MSGTGASWKRYLVIVLLLLYFPFTIKCSKFGTKTRHGSNESRGKKWYSTRTTVSQSPRSFEILATDAKGSEKVRISYF